MAHRCLAHRCFCDLYLELKEKLCMLRSAVPSELIPAGNVHHENICMPQRAGSKYLRGHPKLVKKNA
eukprot:CAMPEP_0206586950 /NCGR_PEP_ID=MMETSP0325_2-20121206/37345_1 /ASSEMBLY_ACC=CAM_ASM_000347 /TAXON_ID=2866 /ORGANISM="Crypthecodinium cohnii, Strain Seligo" /LENGTH=66 /DNA_ID=CAMNT_0054094841 /DNA_START=242 /DNA_END=438 /DNA_ORIENTATION=+